MLGGSLLETFGGAFEAMDELDVDVRTARDGSGKLPAVGRTRRGPDSFRSALAPCGESRGSEGEQ